MRERVTVASPRRPGARTFRRRPAAGRPAVGTGHVRSLMRVQARLTLRTCAVVAFVAGGLPAVFACAPWLPRVRLLGVRLPWLVLCAVVPLVWVVIAGRHVRLSERAEREFAASSRPE